jgi:hypothetical protein
MVMESDLVTVTREEKKEIEKWISKFNHSSQKMEVDTLSLILYKLHQLEEKIDRIEHQTKTHWAN